MTRAPPSTPSSVCRAPVAGPVRTASPRPIPAGSVILSLRPSAATPPAVPAAARQVEVPPGHYEVVLEARCVAYVMDFFTFYGFNGRAVTEGRSFVAMGEHQLDPGLSMTDDATDPRQLGPVFDAEGTPKHRTALVEAGVVTGVTHDRRSAAQAGGGAVTTGHAVTGGEAFGAVATAMFIGPAAGAGRPLASLVSEVEHGLIVSDLWYTRPSTRRPSWPRASPATVSSGSTTARSARP